MRPKRDPSSFPRATHGTPYTYARGCRHSREEGCPGHPETGISCREAWTAYRRIKEQDRRDRRRAELEELRRFRAEHEGT